MSTWMSVASEGSSVHRWLVNSENLQPIASTTSAWRTRSSVAATAPYPSDPQNSGESLGKTFLRSQLVTTGSCSRSTSLIRLASWRRPAAPPPRMATGRSAAASRATASSTSLACGAGRAGRKRGW